MTNLCLMCAAPSGTPLWCSDECGRLGRVAIKETKARNGGNADGPARAVRFRKCDACTKLFQSTNGRQRACGSEVCVRRLMLARKVEHEKTKVPYSKIRSWRLKAKFGITSDDYDAMLNGQGGVCAICGEPPQPARYLAVDHCHSTGIVRALLCSRCNVGLGQFRDRPSVLRKAADYVERWRSDASATGPNRAS